MMDWKTILTECGVKRATAEKWFPAFSELCTPAKFSSGFDEIDDFLAQILHESGMLECMEENLNYKSAGRLVQVFPRYFKSEEQALPFVGKPEKLANYVYGGRNGNSREEGWMYRGRAGIGLTFKDNYKLVSNATGVNYVDNPDLLLQPYHALKVSIAWWEGRVPDAFLNDVVKVSKRVNGGTNGLEHRTKLFETCKGVLNAHKADK
jgi:putative chitinase